MKELTRRDALVGATALGAVALAGCVADDDEPEETGENGTDNGAADSELELIDTGITTVAADCGDGDLVEATVDGSSVVLEGTVPAANPCHEAALDGASLEDGELSVEVGVESDPPEDGPCAQCTGVVDYEATLELSEEIEDLSVFGSLTVEHGGRSGETHTIETAGVAAGGGSRATDQEADGDDRAAEREDAVLSHGIETVETGCTNGTGAGDREGRVDASDETAFTQSGETVTVDGSIGAPTPCYEAVIEEVSYEDGVLSLVVSVQPVDEDQLCTDCIADVDYEATVELTEGTTVDDVSVTHA